MSHEHFKGRFEVELKFRLTSKSEFISTLSDMPHEVMLQDNIESDVYFDTPDGLLQSQNKSLCIREMQPSGIKLWIVKGPEADRCEATDIADAEKACSMLQILGYQVALKSKKMRSIYFIDKFHITVDTLEGIGDFAEFAIMTDDESKLAQYRAELEELAARFGLVQSDLESKSYKEMIMQSRA